MLFVTFAVTPHFLLFPILSYPWKYCVEFWSSKSFPYKLSQTLSSFTKGTNPNPNLRTSYYCDRYLFCHFLNQLTFYFFILHVCKLIKKKKITFRFQKYKVLGLVCLTYPTSYITLLCSDWSWSQTKWQTRLLDQICGL